MLERMGDEDGPDETEEGCVTPTRRHQTTGSRPIRTVLPPSGPVVVNPLAPTFAMLRGKKAVPFCLTIDGLFSAEEMESWVDIAEHQGFVAALVNVGGGNQRHLKDIRNSGRVIIDDIDWAAEITARVRPYLPQIWHDECGSWSMSGVNERLRFLRYTPGQEFKPHFDGSFERADGSETSKLTIQIYLNAGASGGTTRFLNHLGSDDNGIFLDVEPRVGRVLLFEHLLLHSGEPVTAGVKYAVRSDIMFRPAHH